MIGSMNFKKSATRHFSNFLTTIDALKLQLDLVDIGLGHAGKTLKEIVASKTDLGSKAEASTCKVHSEYISYASYACT